MDDGDSRNFEDELKAAALPAGQRHRLAIFKLVESGVSQRIETFCEETGAEVVDDTSQQCQ